MRNRKGLNVLLITIDTLRYDYVGYSRSYQDTMTPFLDELSRDGLTYKWAFSSGTSTPFAFPGILASQYASQKKSPGLLGVKFTFASLMKKMGYRTFGFNGGNMYLSDFYGYNNGLDFLEEKFISRTQSTQSKKNKIRKKIKNILKTLGLLNFAIKSYNRFSVFYKYILKAQTKILTSGKQFAKFLELVSTNEKFFVWFNLMEVHGPYWGLWKSSLLERMKMDEYFRKRLYYKKDDLVSIGIKFYSKALRLLDSKLEKFFNLLDKKGLLNDTLVIITSDHGEEFFEHGGYDHKPKPYDELIRVPLIIYKKNENFSKVEKEKESEKLISLVDLAPSISQYLFGYYPKNFFIGKPTILGGNFERDYIIAEGYQKKDDEYLLHDPTKQDIRNWCIRTKTWKYMELNGKKMFFDLVKDPKEKNPIFPDKYIDNVREYLKDWQREIIKRKLQI